jgi:glycosyltransferase involved in cell wall biosynthesis
LHEGPAGGDGAFRHSRYGLSHILTASCPGKKRYFRCMKIAYLSTFYPLRGGIAQFNASLYRALEKDGHHVKAFTFSRQYPGLLFPGSSQYVSPGDKADPVPALETLDTINPLTYSSTARTIRRYAPDLLLMKFWMPYFAPSLGTVARRIKKHSTVITVLDNVVPHEKRIGDDALIRYFLKQNHGFVAMSEKVRNDLHRYLPHAECVLHPHPLYDHFGALAERRAARKRLGVPEGQRVLLFFGFIRDYKGLDVLIRTLAQLDDRYCLLIGGEMYGDFAPYEKLIGETGTANRIVRHVRYIDDGEVPDFFAAADVCMLPYKSATQSGITSISFHFERPVIATDVGGLKETVVHGETGLIASAPDPALLADQVRAYFDQALEERLVQHIREVKRRLSWEALAGAVVRLYETLKHRL